MEELDKNNLFIPPRGSVQFIFNEYPSTPIWISSKPEKLHYRREGCPHQKGYRIISHVGIGIRVVERDAHPYVCLCMGKFVE